MSLSYEFDYSIRDSGELFLAEVLDGLDLAIMVVDRDGIVCAWNRVLAALTGESAASLEGTRLERRFPALDEAWFHELLAEARILGRVRRYPPATGRRVLASLGAGDVRTLADCAIVRVGSDVAHQDSLCFSFRLEPAGDAD